MAEAAAPLAYCLDNSPAPWARAQGQGNRAAIARAVNWTIELGRIADRAGIESLWLLEDPDGWDAATVLGAIARQTEKIRLGTGVMNPYYRHPSLIAASMSTLDLLSDGRAFLGLGRGQSEWYEIAMGLEVGKPTRRLAETFDLLRQWWSPELVANSPEEATEFAIRDWERVFRPLQSRFPIYLAAVGPIAMRLAARHADGVIFNDLASMQFMREAIATVRGEAERLGRDLTGFLFAARSQVMVTDDPEKVYERRKSTVAMIHTLPQMERLMVTEGYDVEQIIRDVRDVMRTQEILSQGGGFNALRRGGDLQAAKKLIPTSLMEELVVAGSLANVRARLKQMHEAGVTHVFLATPPIGTTADELEDLVASLR
ncbi:MAG TPA: LLM class flavin-dependent oxidoreductase [Thermomicrobiales bacterium]|nr:LLM class flavin-dependent oxidoreductase [Thermomicrobiales bacterium]